MKERPILFSAAMVRALRAGTKTQTRRPVKGAALEWLQDTFDPQFVALPENLLSPYGFAGARLWVREAFRFEKRFDAQPPRDVPAGSLVGIEAASHPWHMPGGFGKVRPSMFMPRWASITTLEVTEIRIERLQDISEADALAEGVGWRRIGTGDARTGLRSAYGLACDENVWADSAKTAYQYLWESINGSGSWDANPWVWAVSFKVL